MSLLGAAFLGMLFVAMTLPQTTADVEERTSASEIVRANGFTFRIQALSGTVLRVERSKQSKHGLALWEDRPTFLVRGRTWPGHILSREDDPSAASTVLSTQHYTVAFSWKPTVLDSLEITVSAIGTHDKIKMTSGLCEIKPAPRLPTPSALPAIWSIRDAPRIVPPPQGPTPSSEREVAFSNTSGFDLEGSAPDAYFFFPKLTGYSRFRSDLLKLIGHIPPLPDNAFGIWFLWNHNYTQAEKQSEVTEFFKRKFPLDVSGLDMDWRRHPCYQHPLPYCKPYVHADEAKYEVNDYLFPDLREFAQWIHARNISLFLNDHPMEPGPSYPELSQQEIVFRWDGLTSLLAQGVDFWWFDCHWGSVLSGIKCSDAATNPDTGSGFSCVSEGHGIDYVAWEKYVQFETTARFNAEHGIPSSHTMQLGCSNSNHLAHHRYPVWWTGDNNEKSLGQAISDMVDAGLQLKPYVHPDCGGHSGPVDYPPEVFARWVQFCSLGSIFRLHSGPNKGRQPWEYGEQAANISRVFMRLRLALMPMFVSAGRRATEDGTPVVRRLDLEFASHLEATSSDQYLLGDDLLIAPVDPWAGGSVGPNFNRHRTVWIPPGEWQDAWTGKLLHGPATVDTESDMETIPVYHRRPGLVVCADPEAANVLTQDWSRLVLEVFPGPAHATANRVFYDTRRSHNPSDDLSDALPSQTSFNVSTGQTGVISIAISCMPPDDDKSKSHASTSTPPACEREFVLRVHLYVAQHATHLLKRNTTLNLKRSDMTSSVLGAGTQRRVISAQILHPRSETSPALPLVSTSHGVQGASPPMFAGEIVEISLVADHAPVQVLEVHTQTSEVSFI